MAENIMLREKLGLKTTEQVRNAQALDSTEWSESRLRHVKCPAPVFGKTTKSGRLKAGESKGHKS